MKNTQANTLLEYLKDHPEGIYVYEMMTPRPQGLGIAQYNARVYDLRHRGYDVRNDQPGHFYLHTNPVQTSIL